jgi:hypothetical protein
MKLYQISQEFNQGRKIKSDLLQYSQRKEVELFYISPPNNRLCIRSRQNIPLSFIYFVKIVLSDDFFFQKTSLLLIRLLVRKNISVC